MIDNTFILCAGVPRRISTRVNSTTFAIGSIARHCVDQYMVLFRYYLLGVGIAMPGGLHARLCHAFLVLDINFAHLQKDKLISDELTNSVCHNLKLTCKFI